MWNHSKNVKKFKIKIYDQEVEHKRQVKYLGINIDDMLRLDLHPKIQLQKARKSFRMNCRLFREKYLDKKSKIICYQLLIRPIITYASPCWFNISASQMENIRAFERECLRVCLEKYRIPYFFRLQEFSQRISMYFGPLNPFPLVLRSKTSVSITFQLFLGSKWIFLSLFCFTTVKN